MAKFTDNAGREWFLSFDVFLLERIKERTGWDGDTCLDEDMKGLIALVSNSPLCARAVYLLCEDEADRRGVSPEQFGRSIGGPALYGMKQAFVEAFADFSPPHLAAAIRAMVQKGTQVAELAAQVAVQRVQAIDPASFVSATTSRASSGSTPAPAG